MELLPSTKRIILLRESPFICYKSVKNNDTTKIIKLDGKQKYQVDTEHYHQLIVTAK